MIIAIPIAKKKKKKKKNLYHNNLTPLKYSTMGLCFVSHTKGEKGVIVDTKTALCREPSNPVQ